jgi:hypothetical protein
MTTAAKGQETTTPSEKLYEEKFAAKPADEKPVEKAAEEKPAEKKAEEKPVEKKPEEKPVEKPAEEKPAEEKPKEGEEKPAAEKPKEVTKETLKLPKDSQLSAAAVDEIVAHAKAQGLSQEQAQAQLERESKLVSDTRATAKDEGQKLLTEKVNEWTETSENDPEFGGEKLKETTVRCNSVLKKYFSPDFVKVLIETGYSNHPELIRGLNRVAKSMDPAQLILAGAQVPGSSQKTADQILYPESQADKKNES